uniref:Mannose-P-dolichol utilization defect 1 protein homolog n=1 Tax=Ascaris lumbricoides TaxID=6252 RepID=A0A9J2PGD4_ASCLU
MATELYHLIDEALRFVFPKNCFEEMLIKLNIFHPECSSLVLSRLLGLAITGGSLMLFIPQIIKIHVARSGAGISLSSQLLGLLSCFATAAYSYASNFVFSQWGDSLFVAIQMAIIVMQILYYSALSAYAFAFLAFCWAITFAVIGNYIPFAILAAFQAITIPLVVASKVSARDEYVPGLFHWLLHQSFFKYAQAIGMVAPVSCRLSRWRYNSVDASPECIHQ